MGQGGEMRPHFRDKNKSKSLHGISALGVHKSTAQQKSTTVVAPYRVSSQKSPTCKISKELHTQFVNNEGIVSMYASLGVIGVLTEIQRYRIKISIKRKQHKLS
jgi:hypothetical protein